MNTGNTLGNTTDSKHLHRHLVCWRSTFAGLAIAVLTFIGVMALAIAFGGIGLYDGTTAQNATVFAGVSLIIATMLATFVGSYFTVRMTRTEVDVLGSAQGLVLAAVFLTFVVFQVMSIAGTIGKVAAQTLGATAAAAGSGVVAASQNPMVQEIIEDNFGDLKTKVEASVVVKGLSSRLLRGDVDGAKSYLANQTGLSKEEADQKIATAKAKLDEAMVKSREAAANTLKATGWSLFVILVLGAIASVLAGLLGTKCNEKYTIDTPDHLKQNYKA